MESFYGEEILMNLLRHSRSISEEVDEFRVAYSLMEEADMPELDEGQQDEHQE